MRRLVAICAVVVGCYAPSAPHGGPCSSTGLCPPGLICSAAATCEPPAADASQAPDTPSNSCPGSELSCGGACVDPTSDPNHCGSCAPCMLAHATASCVKSQCEVASCSAGYCEDAAGSCSVHPDFQTDPANCGGCGTTCTSGSCGGGHCALRAFVTMTSHNANLGGLTGADGFCNAEASAHALGGMWKAWLADDTASPATRFTKGLGPYIRLDGVVIAASWTALTTSPLQHPVLLDSSKQPAANQLCWSDVTPAGVKSSTEHCANWTSTSLSFQGERGQNNLADASWTSSGSQNCDPAVVPPAALYCFEQ